MTNYSRRFFAKVLLTATSLLFFPRVAKKAIAAQTSEVSSVPSVIAGYTLTEEDKALVAKFLATQDKNLISLRERDLPNGLPPHFTPLLFGERR